MGSFPHKLGGEAIRCVYLRTTCRSLNFALFHVFTRVVIVQLFLLGNAVADPFNNFKLLAWRSHLGFSGSAVISEI